MRKSDSVQFDGGVNSGSRRRLLKINSLIQAELGKIIIRELELPPQVLLTITKVEVPADYSQAKVGLSVMPFNQSWSVMSLVQAQRGELQRFLNQRLRIYRVPKLSFYLDDSQEKADNLNRLLDKLT